MQLADTLLRFLLKFICARRKIGILIPEKLIGYLARKKNSYIGLLMNCLTDKVHSHTCADSGYIIGSEQLNDLRQSLYNVVAGYKYFGMLAADIISNLAGIFKVYRVGTHTDGKGSYRLFKQLCRYRAYKRRIKTAAEQKAEGGVGVKPFLYSGYQLFPDISANRVNIVPDNRADLGHIPVTYKFTVLIIMSGRERHNFIRKTYKVFRLGCKKYTAGTVAAVIKGTNTYRVACGNKSGAVINHHSVFGVEHTEHGNAIFAVKRKKNFAVRLAFKGIPFFNKLLAKPAEAVNFSVAYNLLLS